MNTENFNIPFEKSLLSSFIFEPKKFIKYNNLIKASTFYLPTHQNIYDAMNSLIKNDRPIDEEFIKKILVKNKTFDANAMLDIMATNPISNIESYIKELQNLHIKRETLSLTLNLQHEKIKITEFKIALNKIEKLYKVEEKQKALLNEIDYKKLTPFLGNLVQDLMKINNYPPSMVLTTVLTSMAGLVGARAKITNNINLTVFPVVWSMIIAPSSVSAKSTLFRFTKKCIFDNMQNELFDDYENDLESYKEEHKKYIGLSKEDKQRETEPDRPFPKLLIFANDGTPEAKIMSLSRNQNGGVVYYDEMKAELERSNNDPRYKALKTSIFDGELYHKELVKDGGTFILRNPVLSEIGLITEQWLIESVQKNDIASGFMARYLFSYNTRADFKPLQINKFLLDSDKYSAAGKFIIEILNIDRKEPLLFKLDSKAEKYYTKWFNNFSNTAFAVETDEEITASYRLSTYVLKFALLLYIFDYADMKIDIVTSEKFEVKEKYIISAIYIMELFQNENHKILNLFERNKKLNFKIDDTVIKLQKKIRAADNKMLPKTDASNGIRGLNSSKLNELIEQGLFKVEKIDRKTYIMEH